MEKWIRPKNYTCEDIIETGRLLAEITSISVDRKLIVEDGARKHSVFVNIHSTIERPSTLEGVLFEIGLVKAQSPELVCHEDEEHYGIGVFNYSTASTPEEHVYGPDEFCSLDIAYEKNEFEELVDFLLKTHSQSKLKLKVGAEILGLREDCTWNPEKGGLIATNAVFTATSYQP